MKPEKTVLFVVGLILGIGVMILAAQMPKFFAADLLSLDTEERFFPGEGDEKGCLQVKDTDGDLLSDLEETDLYFTDPEVQDTDEDGYSDYLEVRNGYNPNPDDDRTLEDRDEDGLTDSLENYFSANPKREDTDGDGMSDWDEILADTDPTSDKNYMALSQQIKSDIRYREALEERCEGYWE